MSIEEVSTVPIPAQKPGTSGLRKNVKVFSQPHYRENFIQSVFDSLGADVVRGSTIVCGGDGRYLMRSTLEILARIAAANGVSRMIVGRGGLMSTPAVSAVIRERCGLSPASSSSASSSAHGASSASPCIGGFILSASHNPGGADHGDFGIKFNSANGGPAVTEITEAIYACTQTIRTYKLARIVPEFTEKLGEYPYGDDGTSPDGANGTSYEFEAWPGFTVEVIDPCESYIRLLSTCFDFDDISVLLTRPGFRFVFDAMHAVTGPYARRIFVETLGAPKDSVINAVPLEDFGGGHPDPNLTHAKEIVAMTLDASAKDSVDVAAASDGDGDRAMILGRAAFVTPSDSLAIIAANHESIKYFRDAGGLAGVARSMPTSQAADAVARALSVPSFEVPTGWKFFGNLLDSGQISLCGEESFGAGSAHMREKDGLWAILAWLSILALKNRPIPPGDKLVGIADIQADHWKRFGRHYFERHDFEGVDTCDAEEVMDRVKAIVADCGGEGGLIGEKFGEGKFELEAADDFCYNDPVDGSVAKGQGYRFLFRDDSRIVFRKSGTGSSGATVRMYVERFVPAEAWDPKVTAKDAIAPIVAIAHELSKINASLGTPSVIT